MAAAYLGETWTALTGSPEVPVALEVTGPRAVLPSSLPVTEFAVSAVLSSLAAASRFAASEGGETATAPAVAVDTCHVAVAFRSERYVRVGGASLGNPFDPLSRFLPTADGWIRTHANYPWHRARLLSVLGVPDDADAVAGAVAQWPTLALEDAIAAADGCAAAVRSPTEWRAHEQGAAAQSLPLLELEPIGDAPPRRRGAPVRVLDLTRVIAGPVCARTLATHGADVLRVDSPSLPEIPLQAVDTLAGKRSTLLDLADSRDRDTCDELLGLADVVVVGYRPGALDRFGLDPASLAVRVPGVSVLTLSAWGHVGPWAGRRGFDSLVQAASGIARTEGGERDAPGVLPAQVLDHATGYLGAAAVFTALLRQRSEGGSWHARLSLAQTAARLTARAAAAAATTGDDDLDPSPYLVDLDRAGGAVTLVAPPGAIDGRPLAWPSAPPELGGDPPSWS